MRKLLFLRNVNLQIFLSICFAIFCGFYKILPAAFIKFGVDFTILIHQMPVVPYVFISMFLGIGSLSSARASRVVYKLLLTLVFIWLVAVFALFVLARSFSPVIIDSSLLPVVDVGAGYSHAFVPSLIFLVIVASFGLLGMPNKQDLLKPLRVISEMIEYIFEWLLKILPLSLFFLLSHAASVLSFENLHQTSLYVIASLLFCSFFVLWVFPWALYVFANLSVRKTLKEIMPCLWLSFLAGDCAVALPLILQVLKDLLKDIDDEIVGVLIPIAFAVPMAGSIGNLLFIFFSGVNQASFSFLQYALIASMGPLTMFSEPIISIPIMLSLLSLPNDLTPLYMLVSVMTDPIFDAAEAFSIIFICYIVTYSMYKKINLSVRNCLLFVLPSFAILFFLVFVFSNIALNMTNV